MAKKGQNWLKRAKNGLEKKLNCKSKFKNIKVVTHIYNKVKNNCRSHYCFENIKFNKM